MIKDTFEHATVKELGAQIGNRNFWDPYCYEWEHSNREYKMVVMAVFVQMGGDLNAVINKYAEAHDEIYRNVIQEAVREYICVLMTGDAFFGDLILQNRIYCLEREELVELLTEELKRNLQNTHDYNFESCLMFGQEHLNDDSILDHIERRHWREHPDESFTAYQRKAKLHWGYEDWSKSLW